MFGIGRATRRGSATATPDTDPGEADASDPHGLAAMMSAGGNATMAELADGASNRARSAGRAVAGAARRAVGVGADLAEHARDTARDVAHTVGDEVSGAAGEVVDRARGAVRGWKRRRGEKKQARRDKAAEKAAYEAEVAKLGFDAEWAVFGKDDLATLQYLNGKKCTPESVPGFWAAALGTAGNYVIDPEYEHMSQAEIAGVIAYSGQASYGINAVLRGQVKSKNWVKHLKPIVPLATAGLAKLPDGARNFQGTKVEMKFAELDNKPLDQNLMLDPTKDANAVLAISEVYRADGWNPAFSAYFRDEVVEGRTIVEPAFLSTTVIRGSYGGAAPVTRVIREPKGKSIVDLSLIGSEKELLMAPGQRFVIDKITLKGGKKKGGPQPNPGAAFPEVDASPAAVNEPGKQWEVECTHVGGPEASKETKKKASSDGKQAVKKRASRLPRLKKKKLGEDG